MASQFLSNYNALTTTLSLEEVSGTTIAATKYYRYEGDVGGVVCGADTRERDATTRQIIDVNKLIRLNRKVYMGGAGIVGQIDDVVKFLRLFIKENHVMYAVDFAEQMFDRLYELLGRDAIQVSILLVGYNEQSIPLIYRLNSDNDGSLEMKEDGNEKMVYTAEALDFGTIGSGGKYVEKILEKSYAKYKSAKKTKGIVKSGLHRAMNNDAATGGKYDELDVVDGVIVENFNIV